MEKKPYGFIYITTNLINGMKYVGQKKIDGKHRYYLGSGSYLRRAIKKYGKDNFKRTIIAFGYSSEELNLMEQKTIAFLKADISKDYYNIEIGGMKYPLSEHTKELIRQNHAHLVGENSPSYGKKRSSETKKKISDSKKGSIPYNKGVPMSEEQKAKLRNAWKNRKVRVGHHREIYCLETNERYYSINEASKLTNIPASSIQAVLSGRRNRVYGKHFAYVQ